MVPAGSAPPPPRVVVGSSADVGVQAGQLVGNRWRLVQRIGRGAFGDIFIATNEEEQQHYGRQYAIKLEKLALPPAAEGSEPDEEQLKAAQAQAAARAVLKLEAVILSKLQKYPFVCVRRARDQRGASWESAIESRAKLIWRVPVPCCVQRSVHRVRTRPGPISGLPADVSAG